MRAQTLSAVILAFCAGRAGLAFGLRDTNLWPLVPYSMYSGYEAARIAEGILIPAAWTADGRLCRIPNRDFGSRGRLDLTGFYERRNSPALFRELQRLCVQGLGAAPICGGPQFALLHASLAPGERWQTALVRISAERIEEQRGQEPISNLESVFPGGRCGASR